MTKSRLTAYLMLLATSVIWGIAAPVIKFTLNDFPPLIFLTYRFLLTSLVLLPIFALTTHGSIFVPFTRRETWMLILVGLLGSSINLGLLFWGINYTSSISGSLLSATSSVLIVLAGVLFLKEQVTRTERLGLILAFIGSIVIVLSPTFGNQQTGSVLGNFLILLANLAWVAFVIVSKVELKHKVTPLFLTTTSFFLGFISLFPIALLQTGSINNLVSFISEQPISAHAGVWYMALISGALAYYLYQEGQKRIEASEATIFSYLSPIFAAPLALFWLGETITTPFLFGAIIIAGGVVIAEYKKRKSH